MAALFPSTVTYVYVLCLCVGLVSAITYNSPLAMKFAQLGRPVTLSCGTGGAGAMRTWYQGYINEDLYTANLAHTSRGLLVNQAANGVITRQTTRSTMRVDPATFSLTIESTGLTDSRIFTCIVNSSVLSIYPSKLLVYNMTDTTVINVKEGDTATVPCGHTGGFIERYWYGGSSRGPNATAQPVFAQTSPGQLTADHSLSHVSVNPNNFVLTVLRTGLYDSNFFTCVILDTSGTRIDNKFFINVYSPAKVIDVEDYQKVTLSCQNPQIGTNLLSWDHPTRGPLFFGITLPFSNGNNRADMKINVANFELTIEHAQLEDDGFFWCVEHAFPISVFRIVQLKIYIPPLIIGLFHPSFSVGESKTLKCDISRVYPKPHSFQMKWESWVKDAPAVKNSDGSWSYRVERTATLTAADHNSVVNCTAVPAIGEPVTRYEVLRQIGATTTSSPMLVTNPGATSGSGTGASLSVSQSDHSTASASPTPGNTSTATALPQQSSYIYMIAGVAAGAGVLLIIIIVVIVVCCCVKRSGHSKAPQPDDPSRHDFVNTAFHDNEYNTTTDGK